MPQCTRRRLPRAWDMATSRMPTRRKKARVAPSIARKDWRLAPGHAPILLLLHAVGCAKGHIAYANAQEEGPRRPAIARKDWLLAPGYAPILLLLHAAGCVEVLAPRVAGLAGVAVRYIYFFFLFNLS
ncbi:hypothetical protein HAX54_020951 [Datura stramonium]|uniref:Uncharacterized protein n=1 Tax=Datura stramonium TaxID=4076 RepID=A0ABS8UTU6_DATST|nr:hypothetical protein [Datura stramonium]